MGKYGFKITLTREAYENFKKAKELLGAGSWEDLSRRILELIEKSNTGVFDKVSTNHSIDYTGDSSKLVAPATSDVTRISSKPTRDSSKYRIRAIDILRDEKVIYEADVAGRIKNRDAFFERLRRDGAVVVETAKQRIAVDPDFWEEFKKRLEDVDTTNDMVLKEQLGEDGFRLLKTLREGALVYFDGAEKRWKFVAEPEEGG